MKNKYKFQTNLITISVLSFDELKSKKLLAILFLVAFFKIVSENLHITVKIEINLIQILVFFM